jgi:TolA-binding protein
MTKEKNATPAPAEEQDRAELLVRWAKANERAISIAAIVVAVVGGGVWFMISAKERREAFAQRELSQAQSAVEADNIPLAASDLERIVSNYGSTVAGQEAQLLLGQVHLQQGQAGLAVSQLQDFVASGPSEQYRAQAYALLGVALEQTGQSKAAGDAYENGARVSPYQLLAAKLLLDAARAYTTAADTISAARVLQKVVDDFGDSPSAAEAHLRLGELGRYSS